MAQEDLVSDLNVDEQSQPPKKIDFSAFDNAVKGTKSESKNIDFSAFDDVVKKKDGGTPSSHIMSTLPSQDDILKRGKEFAEKGYLQKEEVNPNYSSYGDGSWTNLVQNVVDNTAKAGMTMLHGVASMARQAGAYGKAPALYNEKGEETEAAKNATWKEDPFGKISLGLNGITGALSEDLKYNELPNTTLGKLASSISRFTPDIAMAMVAPEAEAPAISNLLTKMGGLVNNNFTKAMVIKGITNSYGEAANKGQSAGESAVASLKGGLSEGANAVLTNALGFGSKLATKGIVGKLEQKGLQGLKGVATGQAIGLLNDMAAYGLVQPTITAGVQEQRLPTADEMINGAGIATVFGLKHIGETGFTHMELNNTIKKIDKLRQGISLVNFLDATPESIVAVHNMPESAAELNIQALDATVKARKAVDVQDKQNLIKKAAELTKAANVKNITELITANKDSFNKDVADHPEIPDEIKNDFVQKADEIYKQIDPIEIQKRGLGDRIAQAESFSADMKNEASKSTDPVAKAEAEFKASQADNIIEQNKKALNDLIAKQAANQEAANAAHEKATNQQAEFEKVSTFRAGGEEPPETTGTRIATITGLTEGERLRKIEDRKKLTKVSDQVLKVNSLVQDTKQFFSKDKRQRNSSEGLQKLNELRTRAREMGYEIDDSSNNVIKRTPKGNRVTIKYNSKAEADGVIDESKPTLYDRGKTAQDLFHELNDKGIFLDVPTELGTRMSDAQMDATVQDILDGVPSKRANRYLDAIEKGIEDNIFPIYDKGLGEAGLTIDEIRNIQGIDTEKVGQPMDEESLNKFLNGESNLTPEQDQELIDNVENLLHEYENEPETGIEREIRQTKSEPKEGIITEAEQASGTKEPEPTGEKPEPKPVIEPKTVQDLYDSLPESKIARKNEIEKLINNNFDYIIKQLIDNNKIEKIC